MANTESQGFKSVPEGSVVVMELFRPSNSNSKPNGSIFDRAPPSEWKIKWPRNIDFLFVCTGFCAGLGNFWRFPSIALRYGGGSFLLAYLLVLLIVGVPIFYLEVIMGQFVSRAGARVFDCVPIVRGLGYGQIFLSIVVASYYSGIAAISGKYLISSFYRKLPWSICPEETESYCFNATDTRKVYYLDGNRSSADLFYDDIIPPIKDNTSLTVLFLVNYELIIGLLICWVAVAFIVVKGLRILSHIGCFLGFVTFAVLIVLFAQTVLMPNGWDGVLQLFQPDWKEFQSLEIWYDALVQVFFSLGICFGPTTMFASFNKFSYNMFTDILITTSVNALLTIAVGCTFFAAAGNLGQTSHANFEDHFQNVFIYYSEAIAKFDYVPQITSLLLFSLIFLLGIASISALMFFVVQMLRDEFLIKKASKLAVPLTLIAFLFSSVYTTPIGKNVANLLDLYGVPYAIGFNAVLELIAFDWIYGVKRICDDIEFMFGFRTRSIWRMAWYSIPVLIIILLAYQLAYDGIQSGVSSAQKVTMDFVGYATGWGFIVFIIFTIWLWGSYVVFKQPKGPFIKRVKAASRPEPNWGPAEPSLLLNYRYFTLKKDNITT